MAGFRWNAGGNTALSVGETSPTIVSSVPPALCSGFRFSAGSSAGSTGFSEELSPTLIADYHNTAVLCMADTQANSMIDEDVTGTVTAHAAKDAPVVAIDCRNHRASEDVSGTLQAKGNGGYSLNFINPVSNGSIVRRLTPTECERLQGFPDDWTKVPYKGKPEDECPDTPRYKAIGNSMAVPVMRWIGERMQKAEEACQSTL